MTRTRLQTSNTVRQRGGYTIVEMIITVGIFSLAFVAISAIFIGFTNAQSRASTSTSLLNEGNYVLSSIANDIRNSAVDYTSVNCGVVAGSTANICLKHFDGRYIVYKWDSPSSNVLVCTANAPSVCDPNNTTDTTKWTVKNASFIKVTSLKMYAYPASPPSVSTPFQPEVTTQMTISSGAGRAAQSYDLQTTVVSRVYVF